MKRIIFLALITFWINDFIYAGCYPDEHFKSFIEITPDESCIQANVYSNCLWGYELYISSTCKKEYFIYNELNEKLELNTNWSWPTEKSFILKSKKYDYSIPQEYSKWERKLVNINDWNDIIYLNGEIKHVSKINNKNDLKWENKDIFGVAGNNDLEKNTPDIHLLFRILFLWIIFLIIYILKFKKVSTGKPKE